MAPQDTPRPPTDSRARSFTAAFGTGDFQSARKIALALTRRDPDNARAWQWLGAAALCQGRNSEGLAALTRSYQLDGMAVQTLYLIGKAHHQSGRWNEARGWLERTLRHAPDHINAHALLARVYLEKNDGARARVLIDQAVELAPRRPDLLYQRLRIGFTLGRVRGAVEDCQALLRMAPDNPDYLCLAATLHGAFGLLDDAGRLARRALELRPDNPAIASSRLMLAHRDPDLDADDLARHVDQWRRAFSTRHGAGRPRRRASEPNRRLTLGLLSAGLHDHPVGRTVTAGLEQLPADEFRLIAYAGQDRDDPVSERLRRLCHAWHATDGLSDDGLETRIREDQVDILIDLNGHADGHRLAVVANEPAPLIVKWVGGLVNTSGLDAMDYLISDPVRTPPGRDRDYREKLIRLPHGSLCYPAPADAPRVGPPPVRANGFITFGCLADPALINHAVIGRWARLMKEVADSRLLLKGMQFEDAAFRERIQATFADHGVEAERLLLERPRKHTDFLDTYNRVDIALDTWPCSSGPATCEALLMGVPVITLPGPALAGRRAAAHLVNAGLPELVVTDWRGYHHRARELAMDPDNLAVIRSRLRDTLLASPLCDAAAFARSLDTALRGIWRRHCEGLPPAALTFDATGRARFDDGLAPPPPALTPARTLAQAGRKAPSPEEEFEFDLDSRLVVMDNGARLLDGPARALHRLGAFQMLLFDPEGRGLDDDLRDRNEIQYFPGAVLGDGGPATLHACLDPALTGTLAPRASAGAGARVLAELPIRGVALNRIEGLPNVDWLLLDERHDSLRALAHAGDTLRDTLLIQAGVRFQATHQGQPDLGALCAWACANGFQLYRLHDPEHRSHLPDYLGENRLASELLRADALLLPEPARLAALPAARKRRLAFLLHTVHGLKDLAHRLLHAVDPVQATHYLHAAGLSPAGTPIDAPTVFVVGCGHSGTHLMATRLGAHRHIHCIPRQTNWFLNNPRLEQEYPRALAEARRQGKSLLCERTPRHVHRIDEIARRFPRARFIAMVRDGRDVIGSLKESTGCFEDALRRWRDDNRALVAQRKRGTLYLVRYEDLIADPETTLHGVLDFLGEPYDPAVSNGAGGDRRGPSRVHLNEREQARLREECGDLMARFGYHFDSP